MYRKLLNLGIVTLTLASTFGLTSTASAADPVVIRWRTRTDNADEQAVYQKISDSVSAQLASQGITLKYEPQPTQGYFDNLQTQVASGTAPDIFWVAGANTADFVNKGALYNLAPIAAADKTFDVKAFYPPPLVELTHGGALWGLPRDISTLVMYYNADMFTEAGLQTPAELAKAGKWDWAAFLNAAKKLTDPTAGTFGYSDGNWWGLTGYYIFGAGGSWFNKDSTACALNSDAAAKGIQFENDLYNTYKVAPLPGAQTGTEAAFDQGKIGMFANGPWFTPSVRQQAKFKWDVAEMPTGPGGKFTWLFWGAYDVSAKTAHPNEAWTVLKALTAPENQALIAQAGTTLPSRNAQSAVDAFTKSTPPSNAQAFIDGIAYAGHEAPLWTGNFGDVDNNVIEPELSNVFQGKETVAQFSATICQKVDPLLKPAVATAAATAAK